MSDKLEQAISYAKANGWGLRLLAAGGFECKKANAGLANLHTSADALAHMKEQDGNSKAWPIDHQNLQLEPDAAPWAGEKHDNGKPRFDLLPPAAVTEMAKVLTFGAKKYAPENWRKVPDAKARYTAALLRHAFAYLGGETADTETQLNHMAHIMCCAAFLIELEEHKQ
jgi:hypothetical protein